MPMSARPPSWISTAGAAVLVARDVTYTVERTPITITVNCYRGDAYRFTADLFRRLP